ncbi:MAG TPA: DUF6582 domain-containing protein [Streptosporangiaceae bacterium]|nr:DUF6582 domain-containing protein [Streptosporangiaceae bacterium]
MATPIATVGGVALAPGISLNRRLYTKPLIAAMVQRAQARIDAGNLLITNGFEGQERAFHVMSQLTHHDANDDSTRIVGRVTVLELDENGNARFTAELAPTDAGRTIASLIDTSDGKAPFLRGVSIRAGWVGGTRIERGPDGGQVETGDRLDLYGLDYTATPGVLKAGVDTFQWTDGGKKTETSERVLVTESVQEALVETITEPAVEGSSQKSCADLGHACCHASETTAAAFRSLLLAETEPGGHRFANGVCGCAGEASKQPYGKVTYADPGYQTDKKARYPIDTKAHAKAAWSYINQDDNAKLYTGAQLKRVKARIIKALKSFGVKVSSEGWTLGTPMQVTEAGVTELTSDALERWVDDCGSVYLSASNGPVSISISSYTVDPADMDVILKRMADAATAALAELDPDMDGDIDIPGTSGDTDGDSGETAGTPDPADEATEPPALEAGETTETEDPAMAEPQTAAGQAPAGFTQEQVDAACKMAAETAAQAAIAAYEQSRAARKAARRATETATGQAPAGQAPAAQAPAAPQAPGATETQETDEQAVERILAARLAAENTETRDERIERLVSERLDAHHAAQVQSGQAAVPSRKGVVASAETSGPQLGADGLPANWQPLHKMSQEEFDTKTGPYVVAHVLGDRAKLLA